MVPATGVLPMAMPTFEQVARAVPASATAAGLMVTFTVPVATQPLAVVTVRV